MAIAFDTSTTPGSFPVGSSSWSHTTSGSNRILFVGITSFAGDLVTAVTYAGASMTLIGKATRPGGSRATYLYYRIAPTSGANNVSVTITGSVQWAGNAVSYTGVNQTGQPDSFAQVTASSVPTFTMSTTVVNQNAWLVAGGDLDTTPITGGTGTTIRQNLGGDSSAIGDSNGTVSTGSQSLIFVGGGTGNAAGVIASFFPSEVAFNTSDTVVTTESRLFGAGFTTSDTIVSSEVNSVKNGFSPQQKSTSTWTAQTKN